MPRKDKSRNAEKARCWDLFGTKIMTTAEVARGLGLTVSTAYQRLLSYQNNGWVGMTSAKPKTRDQISDVQWTWTDGNLHNAQGEA